MENKFFMIEKFMTLKLRIRCVVSVCFLFVINAALGDVKLPRLISNGMVLQRDAKVRFWGWSDPGEKLSIAFAGKTYTAVGSTEGKWMIAISPLAAGGPYTLQIDANNHITVQDILVGDVWLCSGQSNMALPMERVKERYKDDIANADNPQIRHFFLSTRYDFTGPQEDLPSGIWEAANSQNILRFSAVAYFFAKTLFEKYHVPIGLINSSVGGSPAEAWLSSDAIKKFPEHEAVFMKHKSSNYIDSIRKAENAVTNKWYTRLQQADQGLTGPKKWFDPTYDAAAWPVMDLPNFWKDQGLGDVNGVVWFRKEVNVPASMVGKPAPLLLGRIVDRDSVYVNGVFVGAIGYQYPPRRYEVPAGVLREGKNTIVVRVINSSGHGGFIKDKPYQLSAAGETIDLKGAWQYKLGATAEPLPSTTFFQYKPVGLFNAMIAPLLKCAIKGVIWYQGESNASRPKEYQQLFPALIADWRQQFKQGDFPFLYVQLANFMNAKDQPAESEWAELREAQLKTLAVPNTGMAVIIDLGEWNDIHPLNKADVGTRLALAAEKIAYRDTKVVSSGPLYKSMKIQGNKIIITFTNTGSGLKVNGGGELKYFSIAGADGKFRWAKAKIEGNQVIVWNDELTNPVAVRYAWADNPEGANLYNREGLPASPFRTDK
jgi:sialate O-acetylesterase